MNGMEEEEKHQEINYDDRSLYTVNVDNEMVEELKREALFFQAENEKSRANFSSEEETIYYIISIKWLKKWKKYVSYEEVTNNAGYRPYLGQFFPGPFNSDIISKSSDLLKGLDLDDPLNISIKPYLKDEQDYIIVSTNISKMFYEKYNGWEIPRKAIIKAGAKRVEVYPVCLSLIGVDNDLLKSVDFKHVKSFTVKKILIHSVETVKDLKERLRNLIPDAFPVVDVYSSHTKRSRVADIDMIRIWRLDSTISVDVAFEYVKKICNDTRSTDYRINFQGIYLDKNPETPIEELGLTETDILIVEIREEGKGWNFVQEGVDNLDKCDNCYKYGKNKFSCKCKKVFYCSEECKIKDQRYHMNHCDVADKSDEETEEWAPSEGSRMGITGLSNLGNTCFMNSALQCMSNTYELTQFFLSGRFKAEINMDNPLGSKGKIAKRFASFLKALWYESNKVFSPYGIKAAIANLNPIFSGYQQHDSSEFLNYVLDGLHEDLNRVKVKPIVESIESNNRSDDVVAKESWINHLRRNQSVIVDLMHGQFKSKITCPDCNKISITFDPFLSWSVPIPVNNTKVFEVQFIPAVFCPEKQIKLNFTYTKKSHTLKNLRVDAAEKLGKDPLELFFVSVSNDRLNSDFEDTAMTNDVKKRSRYYTFSIAEMGEGASLPESQRVLVPLRLARWSLSYMNTYRSKCFSYVRPLIFSKTDTGKDVRRRIFKFFRKYFDMVMSKRDNDYDPSKYDDETLEKMVMKPVDPTPDANKEEEKREVDEQQDMSLPYRIVLVTNTIGYSECYFCGQKKCKNCQISDAVTLESLIAKIENKYHTFEIEVIWDNPPSEVSLDVINEFFNPDTPKPTLSTETESMAIEDKKSAAPLTSGGEKNLYDCIKLFSVPETLEEGNEWYCNVCKEHKKATKKMECYRVPKYLVIHLKRFKDAKSSFYNSGSGKNGTKIIFPLEGLDLTTFVTKSEQPNIYLNGKTAEEVFAEITAAKGEKVVEDDEDTKMKIDSMDEGEKNALPKGVAKRIEDEGHKSLIYDCYAVSNHFGNVGFGHYTAYAKNEISKLWYCFDDSSVSEVNPHSVITEAAYLLFYKKRD